MVFLHAQKKLRARHRRNGPTRRKKRYCTGCQETEQEETEEQPESLPLNLKSSIPNSFGGGAVTALISIQRHAVFFISELSKLACCAIVVSGYTVCCMYQEYHKFERGGQEKYPFFFWFLSFFFFVHFLLFTGHSFTQDISGMSRTRLSIL